MNNIASNLTQHKMKINIVALVLMLLWSCKPTQITPSEAVEKLGANPYFEVDDQEVKVGDLGKYKPTDIASLTTYYGNDAIKQYGEKAKDGAVSIETRGFATTKYESFFKKSSKEFEQVMNQNERKDIQYILNDRILTENFEGDLALVDKTLLKSLKIIDDKELASRYKIIDKKIGVVIKSRVPKKIIKSKK
jgi:hypothetical protein